MSQELNRKIAGLMGWEQVDYDTWIDGDGCSHIVGFVTYAHFNPAGCENSAGLVLNKIVEMGLHSRVTVYYGEYKGQGVKAVCCIVQLLADVVTAIADTRPMAICKAFEMAMENRWGETYNESEN
jgi:hypothetical protein